MSFRNPAMSWLAGAAMFVNALPVQASPPQVVYRVPQSRSALAVPTPVVPPGPRVGCCSFHYSSPRNYGAADFNGDGYTDILVAPYTMNYDTPFFPIEIWLNNGDGTFREGAAEVIDGVIPTTRAVNNVIIADFNGDGRRDVLLVDSGIESAVADGRPDGGGINTLLLSQPNGKLKEASSQITPNPQIFNHGDGLGDFNGDGHLDIAISRFATVAIQSSGVVLLIGDGLGHFVETTQGLSQDIRYMPFATRAASDYQITGAAALGDLDGDGRADLITGSYSGNDFGVQHTRTIRFYKSMPDGSAIEQNRVTIPAAIADIGYDTPTVAEQVNGWGLGCSQLLVSDLNGDGRPDVIAQWEGAGKTYIQVLRNDGAFQFTDITLEALGSYSNDFPDLGNDAVVGKLRVQDINGDGTPDLVYELAGATLDVVLHHAVMLNDGTAHFTPLVPGKSDGTVMTASDILPVSLCATCKYIQHWYPMTASGLPSLVLVEFQTDVTNTVPVQTKTVFVTTLMAETPPRLLLPKRRAIRAP